MPLIQFISAIHLCLGLLVLLSGGGLHIASTRLIVDMIPEYHLRAAFYLAAGLLPNIWAYYKLHPCSWTALVPQMVLVMLSALSAGIAVVTSQYADGIIRSPFFIAADQLPYLLLPGAYMYGIYRAETGNGCK